MYVMYIVVLYSGGSSLTVDVYRSDLRYSFFAVILLDFHRCVTAYAIFLYIIACAIV